MVPNEDFLSDADGDNEKDNNKEKNNHNMYSIILRVLVVFQILDLKKRFLSNFSCV